MVEQTTDDSVNLLTYMIKHPILIVHVPRMCSD